MKSVFPYTYFEPADPEYKAAIRKLADAVRKGAGGAVYPRRIRA